MPYFAALFPTSYFCAGVGYEYVPWALFALFFNSTSLRALLIFAYAATVAVGSTVSLNWPLGSGRSGFSLKGLKYFQIDIISHAFLPGQCFGNQVSTVFKREFGWVKLWRIALDLPNLPKFFPATILHYTVCQVAMYLHRYF